MEPSDRNHYDDVDAPSWERDPLVRRALASALEPSSDGARTTQVAFDRLRSLLATERVSLRENSAGRGVRGMGDLGRQTLPRNMRSLAAGFLVSVVGLVFVWNRFVRHDKVPGFGAVSTYTTMNGERANITLPDGSRVTLSVASQLDVPADYAAGNHTVRLSGEALFTVVKHDGVPLTVMAGTTTARVLGTRFSVRHYPTDTTATVAVQDGKVAVGDLVVVGSQFVEVGPRQGVRRGPADAAQFSFATGVLTLPTMPLGQAVVELDRWYGADIRLADSSFARVPTGGAFTTGSLSDLANLLELMLDARVVRDGRVLTLYRRAR